MRTARFSDIRTQVDNGHVLYAVSFTPGTTHGKPGDIYAHMAGTLWVDAAEEVLVRALVYPFPERGHGEPVFEIRYGKEQDGTWLPRYLRINPSANSNYFNKDNSDFITENQGFKRFIVDDAIVKSLP